MSAKRSVIIVTYGRTGSTLLVGLLNSAKGTLIRGENGNVFYHLFKAYETLVQVRKRGGAAQNHPFYGINKTDLPGFLSLCQQAVDKVLMPGGGLFGGPTTIGFKEIRYLNMEEGELSNYLDFMQLIFPDPLFVFLTRDHEQVLSSGFYIKKNNKEKIAGQLAACDKAFANIVASRRNAFAIDYADLKADSARLRDLFAAAGLEYDPARIASVLKVDHSPQTPKHLKKSRWKGGASEDAQEDTREDSVAETGEDAR